MWSFEPLCTYLIIFVVKINIAHIVQDITNNWRKENVLHQECKYGNSVIRK